jgi:hypothetical protein
LPRSATKGLIIAFISHTFENSRQSDRVRLHDCTTHELRKNSRMRPAPESPTGYVKGKVDAEGSTEFAGVRPRCRP